MHDAPPTPPWQGQPYSVKRHGVSITNCDDEPVHTPGCIQAHGALLAVRGVDLVIRHASENTAALLGAPPRALLGAPASRLLGDDGAARLRACADDPAARTAPRHLLTLPARDGVPPLEVSAHRAGDLLLVEFEPASPAVPGDLDARVRDAIARLHEAASLDAFTDALCAEVRALTGLDRVMVYRFHPDDHGEVVAERRRDDLPSWLGLHYPAADIPRPARDVFRRLWVRPVPDVDGALAELVPLADPDTGRAPDLTHCALRGPSVMYTEYLRNMRVAASLTMPLRHGDALWGLVAGHHVAGPFPAPRALRAACATLAQVASLQLRAVQEREQLAGRRRMEAVHDALVARVVQEGGLEALTEGAPALLDGLRAGGAAVLVEGRWRTVGATPPEPALEALAGWLAGQPAFAAATRPLYVTDALAAAFPPAAAWADVAAGLLAVPLSRERRALVLWFRPEVIGTVAWGGNPHDKPTVPGPHGPRLAPRASFEIFRESVRGRSHPWEPAEVEAAARLRLLLAEVVVGRADLRADVARGEARYRLLAEALPHMTWVVRPDQSLEYANRMLQAYTGLDLEAVNRVGWMSLVHPDDAPRLAAEIAGPVARGEPHEAEYRLRWHDGGYRWVLSRGVPMRGPDGALERWLGTTIDIDARRRTEQELRASAERLQLAVLAGRAGTWDLDLVTGRNVWSESHFTLLGLEPTPTREADPALWRDALVPEDLPGMMERWERAQRERGVFESVHRLRRRDGEVIWVRAAGRFFYDDTGHAVRFVGVFFDVTAEKRVERALQESEAWFRDVADASPAMHWVTDADGACTFISRGWTEFTGQSRAEGEGFGWLAMVHPDDRPGAEARFAEANARRVPLALEHRLRHADGGWRWVIDAGRPRTGPTGDFLGYVGLVFDVTARRDAEDALREADRRKDAFLATLAHELRNPLAPIRNGLELLRRRGGGRDEQAAATQAMMERQLGHLVRLVDDLLDVSRITSGKVELRRETLRVRDVVDHAVETSRPLVEAGRQLLAVAHAGEPLWVDGDLTRLAQVVSNLLNNAAKFTPAGRRIDVVARREGEQAVIEVRDEGAGIAPDMLPRIFDLFAQGERAIDRAPGGLGIGLSLARALCALHGGTLDAESPGPGRGSTFTVRLPLAPAPAEAPGANGAGAGARAGRRILVVDDNVDGAESLAMLLRLAGHEVRTAYDGETALATAPGFTPDVVFLDIGLPGLDGYEVARRLRAGTATAGARLVALTGWGAEEDRRRSREAGFDLHLTKPVESQALEQVLAG